jgi:hypothetical protein
MPLLAFFVDCLQIIIVRDTISGALTRRNWGTKRLGQRQAIRRAVLETHRKLNSGGGLLR